MRWSIIRVIWARELRDQLRDRRTLLMIAVLPILLSPVAGFGILQLAVGYLNKPNVVGVVGSRHLPPGADWGPTGVASLVGATAPRGGIERVAGAAALDLLHHYPPLLLG